MGTSIFVLWNIIFKYFPVEGRRKDEVKGHYHKLDMPDGREGQAGQEEKAGAGPTPSRLSTNSPCGPDLPQPTQKLSPRTGTCHCLSFWGYGAALSLLAFYRVFPSRNALPSYPIMPQSKVKDQLKDFLFPEAWGPARVPKRERIIKHGRGRKES